MEIFEKQVQRNLTGKKLEREGQVENAIALYEENIIEGFDGNYPYDRLAIIYRKQRKIDDEIRVLEQAVSVFDKVTKTGRVDGHTKLQKFKDKLVQAIERKNKKHHLND